MYPNQVRAYVQEIFFDLTLKKNNRVLIATSTLNPVTDSLAFVAGQVISQMLQLTLDFWKESVTLLALFNLTPNMLC